MVCSGHRGTSHTDCRDDRDDRDGTDGGIGVVRPLASFSAASNGTDVDKARLVVIVLMVLSGIRHGMYSNASMIKDVVAPALNYANSVFFSEFEKFEAI